MVGALGRFASHLVPQLAQWRIDLVLQQRRARAGAAKADIAPVDDHAVDAFAGQPASQQRAADAAADYERIAMDIAIKRRINPQQAVSDGPE